MTKTFKVTRDSKTLFSGSENECYIWLLDHQPQSTAWAIKYEGYKIEPAVSVSARTTKN